MRGRGDKQEDTGPKPVPYKFYIAGGRSEVGRPLLTAERFSPEVGKPRVNLATGETTDGVFAKWETVAPMQQPRWGAAAASSGGTLYVFGGYDGQMLERTAERYTAETGQWRDLPKMDSRRSQAAAAAVVDTVYICGGFSGSSELRSVACFDTLRETWGEAPAMGSRRLDHAVAAMGFMLYAVGGADDGESLSSVERLNLQPDLAEGEEHAWEDMPPMSEPRRGATATSARGELWVCGGHTGTRCLNSVEALNPRTGEWLKKPPMLEPRFGAAAAFLGEKLYVCGGHSGVKPLSSMERFNFESNEWELMADMSVPRAMAVAALLVNPLSEPVYHPPPETGDFSRGSKDTQEG